MNIRANAYYRLNGQTLSTPSSPLNELLAALAGSIQGVTGGKFGMQQVQSSGVLGPGIRDLLQRQTDQYTGSTRPKAFLNWILLDEQFKIVNSSTGFEPVGADGEFKTFVKTGLPISQNGYLYVYTSNESPVDVFFDNLQVTHVRGPLLEETHYYPFGLTMAGISGKASSFGQPGNKYKYNGIEFDEDLGINSYEAFYRELDPSIGRWWQIDPQADNTLHELSPYSSMHNNPVFASDFLGDFDDYQLKKDGEIELIKKTDDKTDKLFANDNKGNIDKNKSITVEKGILNNVGNGSIQIEGKKVEYDFLKVNSIGTKADKLFEFVANNSNVEWGIMKFADSKSFITTSHSVGSEIGSKGVLNSKLDNSFLLNHTHSHPRGINFPSGRPLEGYESESKTGDIPFAKSIERKYPNHNIIWSIYTPSNGQYTRFTSKDKQPYLQEVIIESRPRKKKPK
jgi:RHS repeat-associated protein